MFKKAFAMFDSGKTGSIEKEKVRTILNTLGHTYDDTELLEMLDAEDLAGKPAGAADCALCAVCVRVVHFRFTPTIGNYPKT